MSSADQTLASHTELGVFAHLVLVLRAFLNFITMMIKFIYRNLYKNIQNSNFIVATAKTPSKNSKKYAIARRVVHYRHKVLQLWCVEKSARNSDCFLQVKQAALPGGEAGVASRG